jgi:hypothetical protein
MRPIITCLLVSLFLACADGDGTPTSNHQASGVPEPPTTVDTVVADTASPDTVMARDTAQSGVEY